MSKRVLWLAISACCLSFVAVSCGDDDDSSPSTPQGGSENAAGTGSVDEAGHGGSSTAGTKSTGADGGVPGGNEGGAPTSAGAGGSSTPGGGGEPTSGGGEPAVGEGGAGGAPIVSDVVCSSLTQCKKGQYCLKADCAAETGVCATPSGTGPVCACNGVTYYDSALAIMAGVDVAKTGICSGAGAKACGPKAACTKGETCGTVNAGRASSCAAATPSVCWKLPAKCPTEKASYNLCTSDKCVGLCAAVQSGEEAIGGALACGIKLP